MLIKFVSTVIAALLVTGTGSPVSPTSGQGAQLPEPTVAAATQLTEAEAIAIALNHASLTETDAASLRAVTDLDDGLAHWDIHWRSGDWVYEYDIHLETGAILEWDRDYEPQKPKSTQPAETKPAETTPREPDTLTRDEAMAIALNHAGLTAGQVTGLRAGRDYDDGVPVYEVEFREGRWEYDYEIHAQTGRILSFDKDD